MRRWWCRGCEGKFSTTDVVAEAKPPEYDRQPIEIRCSHTGDPGATRPLHGGAMESCLEGIGRRYWSVRRLSAPLHRGWLRVEREGMENVPEHGGVILAANHLSFIDSVLLMYSGPRRVSFLGKAEYLSMPATRRLFPAAGMIPVDRSGRGVGRSLGLAIDRLKAGEIVGIFPEGTRSRDGYLHEGHVGVAHLALKSGAPIIPVGITGTEVAMPPDSLIPRRTPITLRFGAPIDLGRWSGCASSGADKREITAEVMHAIAALSGQRRAPQSARTPMAYPAAV